MKILLTGGTGFVGSHAAVALARKGHAVVLFDNLSNSDADVVNRLEIITGSRPQFVQGDIRHKGLLEQTLRTHRIEAVMHFAGLKSVSESVAKPLDYFDNNVGGTIALLQAMDAAGIRVIVFSSSATVYGDPRYLPIDEEHPRHPTNPYGATKLHIEDMLARVAQANPAWRAVCLRYFNPAGAHESGLIGEEPSGTPNNLMPLLLQVAAGRRSQLDVYGNDYDTKDGTGARDYIHVMDLAEGHLAALDFAIANPGWHAVNLGTGRSTTVLEMIAAFEQATGRTIARRIAPRRAGDVACCYAKTDQAQHLLGWKPRRTVNEMCASAWQWQAART